MTIAVGQNHPLNQDPEIQYSFISYHHMEEPTEDKSVWTIELPAELDCFERTFVLAWFVQTNQGIYKGWGLRLTGTRPTVIGKVYPNVRVKVAEFKSDRSGTQWHGYPIDKRGVHVDVAGKWREAGIISKKKMKGLVKGNICCL